MRFVLASGSPRRRELLEAAGFAFDVDAVDIDERQQPGEAAAVYVERLAREKAAAGAARHPTRPVLGADTTVVAPGDRDDLILAKPVDAAEAVEMLRALSGRAHDVLTGIALAWDGRIVSRVARTTVWMSQWPDDAIERYIASGDPFDKAGAYAIQGFASRFISRIDGTQPNVAGLPVDLVDALLAEAGLR